MTKNGGTGITIIQFQFELGIESIIQFGIRLISEMNSIAVVVIVVDDGDDGHDDDDVNDDDY